MVFALHERQRAAIQYLQRIPQAVFENEDVVNRAFNWLVKRGAKGKKHAEQLERAFRGLKVGYYLLDHVISVVCGRAVCRGVETSTYGVR